MTAITVTTRVDLLGYPRPQREPALRFGRTGPRTGELDAEILAKALAGLWIVGQQDGLTLLALAIPSNDVGRLMQARAVLCAGLIQEPDPVLEEEEAGSA